MIITLVIAMVRIVQLTIIMITATALTIMDEIVTVMIEVVVIDKTKTMPIIMSVIVTNHPPILKVLLAGVLMLLAKLMLKEERQ